MEGVKSWYNQSDATGFIRLNGLRLRARNLAQGGPKVWPIFRCFEPRRVPCGRAFFVSGSRRAGTWSTCLPSSSASLLHQPAWDHRQSRQGHPRKRQDRSV